jgi:hypothetical protein
MPMLELEPRNCNVSFIAQKAIRGSGVITLLSQCDLDLPQLMLVIKNAPATRNAIAKGRPAALDIGYSIAIFILAVRGAKWQKYKNGALSARPSYRA